MRDEALVRLRRRLIRHYDIVTEIRSETLGYGTPGSEPSATRRLFRAVESQFLPHYFAAPPRWRKYLRRISRKRTLPDFCVVGPPKCATSDLAVSVLLHPNVMPPLAKEFPYADPDLWRLYYPTEREKRRFAAQRGLALSPYLHPSLHWIAIPYNLAYFKPDAKIVVVLRDPVRRLYSHWKWELFLAGKARAGRLPFLHNFSDYVDKSIEMHGNGLMYTASGAQGLIHSIYWKSVETWVECFGRSNVLVLDISGYFAQQEQFMGRLYDFVGLPRTAVPEFDARANENPLKTPPADKATVSKLKEFFAPYNEKLWGVIGEKFDW